MSSKYDLRVQMGTDCSRGLPSTSCNSNLPFNSSESTFKNIVKWSQIKLSIPQHQCSCGWCRLWHQVCWRHHIDGAPKQEGSSSSIVRVAARSHLLHPRSRLWSLVPHLLHGNWIPSGGEHPPPSKQSNRRNISRYEKYFILKKVENF